jgi:hypothetical protein
MPLESPRIASDETSRPADSTSAPPRTPQASPWAVSGLVLPGMRLGRPPTPPIFVPLLSLGRAIGGDWDPSRFKAWKQFPGLALPRVRVRALARMRVRAWGTARGAGGPLDTARARLYPERGAGLPDESHRIFGDAALFRHESEGGVQSRTRATKWWAGYGPARCVQACPPGRCIHPLSGNATRPHQFEHGGPHRFGQRRPRRDYLVQLGVTLTIVDGQ